MGSGDRAAASQARPASPAVSCFCSGVQDVRAGGRQGNAEYQYTLQADDAEEFQMDPAAHA